MVILGPGHERIGPQPETAEKTKAETPEKERTLENFIQEKRKQASLEVSEFKNRENLLQGNPDPETKSRLDQLHEEIKKEQERLDKVYNAIWESPEPIRQPKVTVEELQKFTSARETITPEEAAQRVRETKAAEKSGEATTEKGPATKIIRRSSNREAA